MTPKLESYKSVEELGKTLGVSKVDIALIRAKKLSISKLRQAREEQDLTQAQVAKLVGTKQPAIARMEAGLVSEVTFDFLFKVAWVLDVKLTLTASKSRGA